MHGRWPVFAVYGISWRAAIVTRELLKSTASRNRKPVLAWRAWASATLVMKCATKNHARSQISEHANSQKQASRKLAENHKETSESINLTDGTFRDFSTFTRFMVNVACHAQIFEYVFVRQGVGDRVRRLRCLLRMPEIRSWGNVRDALFVYWTELTRPIFDSHKFESSI